MRVFTVMAWFAGDSDSVVHSRTEDAKVAHDDAVELAKQGKHVEVIETVNGQHKVRFRVTQDSSEWL